MAGCKNLSKFQLKLQEALDSGKPYLDYKNEVTTARSNKSLIPKEVYTLTKIRAALEGHYNGVFKKFNLKLVPDFNNHQIFIAFEGERPSLKALLKCCEIFDVQRSVTIQIDEADQQNEPCLQESCSSDSDTDEDKSEQKCFFQQQTPAQLLCNARDWMSDTDTNTEVRRMRDAENQLEDVEFSGDANPLKQLITTPSAYVHHLNGVAFILDSESQPGQKMSIG